MLVEGKPIGRLDKAVTAQVEVPLELASSSAGLKPKTATTVHEAHRPGLRELVPIYAVSIYGGYFGAGLGIMTLAVLGLLIDDLFTRVNALKQAISFVVNCETQEEIDYYWEKLSAGGGKVQCGWLKDKFGVSWQVVPAVLGKYMSDKDPAKSGRVMAAIMQMTKIEIEKLRKAYEG